MHRARPRRTNRAHFMAEQRPICVAQPAAAEVHGSGMDGRREGSAVTLLLSSIEGGIDSRSLGWSPAASGEV